MRAIPRAVVLVGLATLAFAGRAAAEPDTREIFERSGKAVFQIQVVEVDSGAKARIGSGFAVSPPGTIVTNFHVIAETAHHPDRYRAELISNDGQAHPLALRHFSVVDDLAVLRAELPFDDHLSLESVTPTKGQRIYSIGNPLDLGLSIVEGTYNGLLEHSRDARIHFTGSLNPGMSGGPAILADGRVVGINVASSGNQIGFLIPVARARDAVARALSVDARGVVDPTAELARQLLDYQQAYMEEIGTEPFELVEMGPYRAPTRLADHFNCWADAVHDEDDLYEARIHRCSSHDSVYVSDQHNFSPVRMQHGQLQSGELSPAQFYELYTMFFENNNSYFFGDHRDFTEFRCDTGFVDNGGLALKTTFCVRRYKKLPGLYDTVLKAAALGRDDSGFETSLLLSAVSFENAEKLSRRYLEAISWSE